MYCTSLCANCFLVVSLEFCINIRKHDGRGSFVLLSLDQARVVRKVDNAIHRINHYPVDSVVCFVNTYPLDSDLSGG